MLRTRAALTLHDFDGGRTWRDNNGATLQLQAYGVLRTYPSGHCAMGMTHEWLIGALCDHGPYTQVQP